jgi:hypothetical protein
MLSLSKTTVFKYQKIEGAIAQVCIDVFGLPIVLATTLYDIKDEYAKW